MNSLHMNLDDAWNYILSGLDVVGLVALRAVGKKKAVGWLWAMFTQAVWVVYSISTLQWGFLVVALVKLGVYTWNWVSWVRGDKAEAKPKTNREWAFQVLQDRLPEGIDAVTRAQAIHFLSRAITVAEQYPHREKTLS